MGDSKIPGTAIGVDPEDTKKEKKNWWERVFTVDILFSPNIWIFIFALSIILLLVAVYFDWLSNQWNELMLS